MTVTLILRNQEHTVKSGMTLGASLHKIDILPKMVLATRQGQLITEDEILKDGDVVKLISVISGGAGL